MDAVQRKRSKVSAANRSSGEGNRQTPKQWKSARLASDSSSCSSGITDEDSVMFEFGRRSSRQPAGTPIKKLLAKEMSQESESRKRSQSVIARLMGLEDPPPLQPVKSQRQQRRCPEENRLTAKLEKVERSSPFSSRRSSRRSSKEEQEFKDVYEVVDAPKVERISHRSLGTGRPNITSDQMAFIRQTFMEAKRLSTDDKLQDSKEFHDAIEVLSSNKDLLLKFLQEPESLFTKHVNDLNGAQLKTHCSRLSPAKSSRSHDCELNYLGLKSGREKRVRKTTRSAEKHKNHYSGHPYSSSDSLKPPKLEGRKDSDIVPTRIVVLKPNLGKVSRSTRSPLSHPSNALLSDSSSLEDFPSFRFKDMGHSGRQKLNGDLDLVHWSNGSQEIAKEIALRMKNEHDSGSPSIFPLKIRPYWGDSSPAASMSDTANESDATILMSTMFSSRNNHSRHASCSTESSVTKEAKRRLSRRWKMTHRSEDIGELSRGSTLADMLSIPDPDARCVNADALIGRKAVGSDERSGALVEPLGISSRDGWKDVCVNNLSRSRSVPSSSNFSSTPRANRSCEARRNCTYTVPRETIKWEKNKKVIGHPDSRDVLDPRKLRLRQSNHHSNHFLRGESSGTSGDIHRRQKNHAKASFTDVGPLSPVVSEAPATIAHEDLVKEHENKYSSTETLHPQLSMPFLNSSSDNLDDRVSKEPSDESTTNDFRDPFHLPVPELQSSASSKEADQPSPVSTLEAPFTDDLSSGSECFESLSADLHGLRMQLQLLKLESEAYGEGRAILSSDEDVGEGPLGSEDQAAHITEGSWESSYITDILAYSEYIDYDPETFVSKLHSIESPVDPLIFEELEKRHYGGSSTRPERRLLFDRLNSGLNEIYLQLTDPHPWVTAMRPATGFKVGRDGLLLDGLCRSLAGPERKAKKGTLDKVVTEESQWLNLGDDVDVIGKEVERLIVDDIVAEVVVELM